MKNDLSGLIRNGSVRVKFYTLEERQRAFGILEERGFTVPEKIKDPASFEPRGTPGATNVLDINLRRKELNYNPPPFICACMCSAGIRFCSVEEFERMAELGMI